MKIAIISDIHENVHNLALFFEEIQHRGGGENIEKIIFLWDFINNGIAKLLANSPIPVYAIRGNNDGERVAITKTSLMEGSNLELWFDTFDSLTIDGRNIFITHYPMLAKPMARSGDFDAVFYGHDHKYNKETNNSCLIINPWEISAHKTTCASFAIYDTQTNEGEIVILKNSISTRTETAETFISNNNLKYGTSKSHQY